MYRSIIIIVITVASVASFAPAQAQSLADKIRGFDIAGVKLSQSCQSAITALARSGWQENDDGTYIAFEKPYENLALHCIQAPSGSLVSSIQYVAQETLISPAQMRDMVVRKYGPPEFIGLAYPGPADAEVLAWGEVDHPQLNRPQFISIRDSAGSTLVSYFASPSFTQKANILRLSAGEDWIQGQVLNAAEAKKAAIRRMYKPSFVIGPTDDKNSQPAACSPQAATTCQPGPIPK